MPGQRGSPAQRARPAARRAIDFLCQFQREVDAVPARFAALVEADVLIERTLDTRVSGRVAHQIRGVRVVDRERLTALDDATLAAWARSGLLEVVYVHLRLLDNLRHMID